MELTYNQATKQFILDGKSCNKQQALQIFKQKGYDETYLDLAENHPKRTFTVMTMDEFFEQEGIKEVNHDKAGA